MTDAGTWKNDPVEEAYTRMVNKKKGSFSEKEMTIFRWMCFHVYLGGAPDSNPNKADVFKYFHGAMAAQCEFMYDKMTGPGMTGIFASCGYTKYSKEMDTWWDEHMEYVTDVLPLSNKDFEWFIKRKYAVTTRLILVVARMMNAYQLHYFDMASIFALTEREWELWCQHWHMYKRDVAIGNLYAAVPAANV